MTMRTPTFILIASLALLAGACANPFAPTLDENLGSGIGTAGDTRTIDGVFQTIQYAYAARDTLTYGRLLDSAFQFRYYNAERAADVVFTRDEEMRTTYNLFRGVALLDLQWNAIIAQEGDSLDVTVTRPYNLRIALTADDVIRVDGRATLHLLRISTAEPWRIRTWRDDSSF